MNNEIVEEKKNNTNKILIAIIIILILALGGLSYYTFFVRDKEVDKSNPVVEPTKSVESTKPIEEVFNTENGSLKITPIENTGEGERLRKALVSFKFGTFVLDNGNVFITDYNIKESKLEDKLGTKTTYTFTTTGPDVFTYDAYKLKYDGIYLIDGFKINESTYHIILVDNDKNASLLKVSVDSTKDQIINIEFNEKIAKDIVSISSDESTGYYLVNKDDVKYSISIDGVVEKSNNTKSIQTLYYSVIEELLGTFILDNGNVYLTNINATMKNDEIKKSLGEECTYENKKAYKLYVKDITIMNALEVGNGGIDYQIIFVDKKNQATLLDLVAYYHGKELGSVAYYNNFKQEIVSVTNNNVLVDKNGNFYSTYLTQK